MQPSGIVRIKMTVTLSIVYHCVCSHHARHSHFSFARVYRNLSLKDPDTYRLEPDPVSAPLGPVKTPLALLDHSVEVNNAKRCNSFDTPAARGASLRETRVLRMPVIMLPKPIQRKNVARINPTTRIRGMQFTKKSWDGVLALSELCRRVRGILQNGRHASSPAFSR